jgi:hypothetical protein
LASTFGGLPLAICFGKRVSLPASECGNWRKISRQICRFRCFGKSSLGGGAKVSGLGSTNRVEPKSPMVPTVAAATAARRPSSSQLQQQVQLINYMHYIYGTFFF